MAAQTLQEILANLIASELQATVTTGLRGGKATGSTPITDKAVAVSERLLENTFKAPARLKFSPQNIHRVPLTGGNTAGLVAEIRLHLAFALKFDCKQQKLAEEGTTMRAIKANTALPEAFREAWPEIYAIHSEEGGPYAYLMEFFPKEDGWLSLEERLYRPTLGHSPSTEDAKRWMARVLDTLFQGYEASVQSRSRPNLLVDYFQRMKDRLAESAARDPAFVPQRLVVNGQPLAPWNDVLDQVLSSLDAITPGFTTVAHGDPNPGNLMLRDDLSGLELKLIDPKEWIAGDYLFDIAKIAHFLEGTGPIENPLSDSLLPPEFIPSSNGTAASLVYTIEKPSWTTDLVEQCLSRVTMFAEKHGDRHWRERYLLSMAANLLGLPLGRLNKDRRNAALALYGEGLKYLQSFCDKLGLRTSNRISPSRAPADDLEPAQLKWLRDYVRLNVPDVAEAKDRRGFQLLHWQEQRANQANKPTELTLEHEARLVPANEAALTRLLRALNASEGLAADQLLGEGHSYGHLVVRRYSRASGAQSMDHYFDVDNATFTTSLLPALITVRERIRTSKFMTWSTSDAHLRPLNLEMPFLQLGNNGMTTRLEFNWIDNLATSLEEANAFDLPAERRNRNPLVLAQLYLDKYHPGLQIKNLVPVLEHTTYRQKFGFKAPANSPEEEVEVFVLNVDTVVAQDLKTLCTGSYVDVDISSVNPVSELEIRRLNMLVDRLAERFSLKPNLTTKALRSAEASGMMEVLENN